MNQFAHWLSTTSLSIFLQTNQTWTIRTIQSIHIVGIGIILGSALMMTLRVVGLAGTDRTLLQTERRFGPWLIGAFVLLAITGVLMIIGEPARELITFSFWAKMILVAAVVLTAAGFQLTVRRHAELWEQSLIHRKSIKLWAVVTFLLLLAIVFLGRLIAYDHVWGAWSPAKQF